MPAPLPDCARCDAADSLEVERGDGKFLWCVCRVCSKSCIVFDGRVVHPPRIDVSGVEMHDP